MLQRLSVRGKILAVVAVPILVLLLAVGVVTLNAFQTLSGTRNVEQLLDVLSASREFEADFQTERNLSVNYVDSYTGGSIKRNEAQTVTDTALSGLEADVAANPTPEGEEALAQITAAVAGSDSQPSLEDLRATNVTENGTDEWPTFPSAEDIQAMADGYAAMGTEIEEINDQTPDDAGLAGSIARVSFAVNFEGTRAESFLAAPALVQDDLIAAMPKTDASEAAYDTAVDAIDDIAVNQSTLVTTRTIDDRLTRLGPVRKQVVNRTISVSVLNSYFGDTLQPVVKLSSDVANVATDRDLATQLRGYSSMDVLVERILSEEVYTDHLLRQGFFLPGDSTFQRELVALSDISLASAQDTVVPSDSVEPVPGFGASAIAVDGESASFESIRSAVATGLDSVLVTERGNDWPLQVTQELDVQIPIRDALWSDAQETSSASVQSTVLTTIVTIVGGLLVVVATIFIALLIARRIIGPLRRLTTTATAVRQELPRMVERVAMPGETVDVSEVQIPVESSDEIGRLAEAFNGVNATTLAIASEQAALRGSISEMFVNVARRDQVLLNRQLSSIDDMERTEDDPETLTRLFALDHLATRMRRNSESLLVLAGIDTGRRLRRPMPLADVIRTASSEIELYERVQLELDADPAMVGHSALTAAHLFAELLENATVFSDPGTQVVVRTFEHDGEFVVEVIDSGIGMTTDELREANNRVASTAASEILGAQRLGLFVVGRIARRVGARVSIDSKEGKGTTATVSMPQSLFDSRSQEPVKHVSGTAADAAMHAPSALVGHSVADEIIDNQTEPDATKRPAAAAYKPAAVESGTSLAGRGADDQAATSPAAGVDTERSVDDLIAADAAVAPEATPVDTASLSGGVTASGLPARRRRTAAGPDATSEEERAKIIGLPARATADQLSALDAEAPGGFKPAVSAEEIAPQTAEERASMFRGFRARKDVAPQSAMDLDPEAESMGQAARRGAFVDLPGAEAQSAPEEVDAVPEIPVLEDDDPATVEDSRPSFAMPKFDARPEGSAGLGLAAGAGAAMANNGAHEETRVEPAEEAPFVVPVLEEDDVPAPVESWGEAPVASEPQEAEQFDAAIEPDAPVEPDAVPEFSSAPELDVAPESGPAPQNDAAPELDVAAAFDVAPESDAVSEFDEAPEPPSPSYGVEQVSLETGPTFPTGAPMAPPAPQGEPLAIGVDPAPQTPQPVMDPAQLAELTATPSMDELMAGDEEEKPSFFTRLFGRGKKGTEAEPPTSEPAVPVSEQPAAYEATAASRGFAPATPTAPSEPEGAPNVPFTPAQEYPAPASAFEPAAPTPQVTDDVQEPPAFSPYQAPEQASLPEPEAAWQPTQVAETTSPAAPVAPVASAAAGFFTTREPSAPQQTSFSPDELANPLGWEAAGASALQAAEPDVQTSYSPKVDLDADNGGGSDLSSVFSEFSSLSSQRPKVEKTRAGLQKRRAADAPPVEVTPIADEVVVAPRERNADDVRSRFSSFYSGTARARSDAAEFERSQTAEEVKE